MDSSLRSLRSAVVFSLVASVLSGCLLFEDLEPPGRHEDTGLGGAGADAATFPDVGTPDSGTTPPTDAARVLDEGASPSPDAGEEDLPEPCVGESEEALCIRLAIDCGEAMVLDSCGEDRAVSCGDCIVGTCGAQTPNVCGCPCEIDDRCYPDGAVNPQNGCEVCDPSSSPTGWTVRVDATCDDGDLCTVGDRCASDGTCGQGATVDCSQLDGPCGSGACDSSTGACEVVPAPDDTSCGLGDVSACAGERCQAGTCELVIEDGACFIDDSCIAAGTINPGNECQRCDPARSVTSWWHVNDGTTCGSGNPCRCERGMCERPNGSSCQ